MKITFEQYKTEVERIFRHTYHSEISPEFLNSFQYMWLLRKTYAEGWKPKFLCSIMDKMLPDKNNS